MLALLQVALCTYTTSSSLGFRLCGMRYRDDNDESMNQLPCVCDTFHQMFFVVAFAHTTVIVRGKPWGAKLNAGTMPNALMEFVTQFGHIRFDLVEEILRQLRFFTAWFATQTLYKFYSSSILFVYDAAGKTVRVKLGQCKISQGDFYNLFSQFFFFFFF